MPDKRCCRRCFKVYPADQFHGEGTTCRTCASAGQAVRKHGITSTDKAAIAAAQDGCAICGSDAPGGRGWVVDHDHECCPGIRSCRSCRRGILCHRCNTALGYAGDSPELLRRMADYLELGTRLVVESEVDIRTGVPNGSDSDPTNVDNERTYVEGQDVGLSGSFAERVREASGRSQRIGRKRACQLHGRRSEASAS